MWEIGCFMSAEGPGLWGWQFRASSKFLLGPPDQRDYGVLLTCTNCLKFEVGANVGFPWWMVKRACSAASSSFTLCVSLRGSLRVLELRFALHRLLLMFLKSLSVMDFFGGIQKKSFNPQKRQKWLIFYKRGRVGVSKELERKVECCLSSLSIPLSFSSSSDHPIGLLEVWEWWECWPVSTWSGWMDGFMTEVGEFLVHMLYLIGSL